MCSDMFYTRNTASLSFRKLELNSTSFYSPYPSLSIPENSFANDQVRSPLAPEKIRCASEFNNKGRNKMLFSKIFVHGAKALNSDFLDNIGDGVWETNF